MDYLSTMRVLTQTIPAAALLLAGCNPDLNGPRPGSMTDEARAAWVLGHAVPVRTLSASDADFADLEPLRAAIGTSRIVMLGEQTHGDGTTFAAKVRLVRFLHQEMGFDVLAFEAGLFDVHQAWKGMQAGNAPLSEAQRSIFEIWSHSAEVRPLFEYVGAQASGATPLELAGIDPQFTGPIGGGTGAEFIPALEGHLTAHGSTLAATPGWAAFREVARRIAVQHYRTVPSTPQERATFAQTSPTLRAALASIAVASPGETASRWAQVGDALDHQARSWWALHDGTGEYGIIRDSSMARNLTWLLGAGAADRKVIVWAHSGHIASNVQLMSRRDGSAAFPAQYRPLGDLVRAARGDDLYSIGFLAGGGYWGFAAVRSGPVPAAQRVPPVLEGSWEDFFILAERSHLFLDLRAASRTPEGDWLNDYREASPIGYEISIAPWPEVYDAFFFSRVMVPATAVTR